MSTSISAKPSALRRYLTCIRALLIRDMMVRFGRNNLGFVWVILEPMLLTCGVLGIWSLLREPTVHGIPIISFVLTVYMPLTMWRHMTSSMIHIVSRNSGLLYHQPISHLDIVVARLLLDFISTTAALATIYLILLATNLTEPVQDWGLLLCAWLFVAWYHAALGLLIAGATERWETAEKFIQPLQYLALPLSGVWFMVGWLPSSFQRVILWNPAVHCFEMFRAGFFGESVPTFYDPLYLGCWSLALTVLGIIVVINVRDHVET